MALHFYSVSGYLYYSVTAFNFRQRKSTKLFVGEDWIQKRQCMKTSSPEFKHINHFVNMIKVRYNDLMMKYQSQLLVPSKFTFLEELFQQTHTNIKDFWSALEVYIAREKNNQTYKMYMQHVHSFSLLKKGGRLVVVTFHSLEQSIVTGFIKRITKDGFGVSLTGQPVKPTDEEIARNPKSRSALLNGIEKTI